MTCHSVSTDPLLRGPSEGRQLAIALGFPSSSCLNGAYASRQCPSRTCLLFSAPKCKDAGCCECVPALLGGALSQDCCRLEPHCPEPELLYYYRDRRWKVQGK